MNWKTALVLLLAGAWFCTAAKASVAQDDIGRQRSCARCGMDRKAFGYSRMNSCMQQLISCSPTE
jgi:hypothetical protein